MARKIINTGTSANDGTGDNLRSGGAKVNDNFSEIYNILGDGSNLLNNDIDFGPNKLLFSNTVSSVTDLSNISANTYPGLIIQVEQTGALYYAYSGTWKKLLSDTSSGSIPNYDNPLSTVAYSGDYNELLNRPSVPTSITDLSDVTDGSAGQVLTTDGVGNFTFRDITATSVAFAAITDKPTTISGYGIIDAFTGAYADLTGKPALFSGSYTDLTNKPSIATDLSQLTDSTNLLFSKNYNDLTNKPAIPNDINDLADTSNLLFSGSYTDLSNKPTLFTGLSSIGLALGVNIDEFSTDSTLAGASDTVVPTEAAIKTYVDTSISNITSVYDQELNTTDSVQFLAVDVASLTTTNNIKFNSNTVKGIGLADDSVRLLMYGTDSGLSSNKATLNTNFEIDGEIQWVDQGNDTLTKIFAQDSHVIINNAATRSLMLQNYQPISGVYQNNGITLNCVVDTQIFGTEMQLQIGDASNAPDRAVKIMGQFYTDSFGNDRITEITLGGIYNYPDNLNPIQPQGVGEIWRLKAGHFELLDTDRLVVNNDLELKGHLTSSDSTILIDTEQNKFFGSVVGSVFADNSTLLVDAVNGTIPGYISLATLKSEVAASIDFADFQSRIAAL